MPTSPTSPSRSGPPRPPATPLAGPSGSLARPKDRKRPREEEPEVVTLEERARNHNNAKRLATAGAWLPTPVKTEPTEEEDPGTEVVRAEIVIDDEMPASAATDEANTAQATPPETRASSRPSNSSLGEQDLDLILNVQDHDQLDFEPEEGILDDTIEVKCVNKFLSLRPDFRTDRRGTTRLPRRDEEIGCLNITSQRTTNFINQKSIFINEITTIIIYLYYLYYISRTSRPQISIVISYERIVC